MRFSPQQYAAMLEALKAIGRQVGPLGPARDKGIILRADVDYDLAWAAQLAELNASAGVKATFFVQIDSPLYNPLAPDQNRCLRAILAAGQEVGLHYYAPSAPSAQQLTDAWEILNSASGQAAKLIAWHNPPADVTQLEQVASQAGLTSAYSPAYFGPGRYVSDSNCRRSADDIIKFAAESTSPLVQVLVHPLIWVLGAQSMQDVLRKALRAKLQRLDEDFSSNSVYQAGYGQELFEPIRRTHVFRDDK